MTISEYTTNLARKDARFMRFLKELNLQRIYFKSAKLYPQDVNITKQSKKYYTTRMNRIVNAFCIGNANTELVKHFPNATIDWNAIDTYWYQKATYIRKPKNLLKITNHLKTYMTK